MTRFAAAGALLSAAVAFGCAGTVRIEHPQAVYAGPRAARQVVRLYELTDARAPKSFDWGDCADDGPGVLESEMTEVLESELVKAGFKVEVVPAASGAAKTPADPKKLEISGKIERARIEVMDLRTVAGQVKILLSVVFGGRRYDRAFVGTNTQQGPCSLHLSNATTAAGLEIAESVVTLVQAP